MRASWAASICAITLISLSPLSAQSVETYDIVIRNGRVMDPESGTDAVMTVGIRGDAIAAITADTLWAKKIIDARGLVVAPGFIDILSYAPREAGNWNKLADGVTTNLAMHGGTAYPTRWYRSMGDQKPPLHYGASFFYTEARNRFVSDRNAKLAKKHFAAMHALADSALRAGALGVSFSLEYVPGISSEEILPLMRLAKRYEVPVFFHARYSDMEPPGTNLDAIDELAAYADSTGAAIHIDHINSTGGTFSMPQSIERIEAAQRRGLDITACVYPYTFWGTYLNSARFDKGWQQRFRISYDSLQLGGSAERLTESSFKKYRAQGKLAIAYAIPNEDVVAALKAPWVMIGSDAILEWGYNNHPRASGTFSRTIAVYVREQRAISLMEAISKMALQPARRLERGAPAFKKKGRLSVGADADIVVFDPEKIRDRSTVEHPEYPSTGMQSIMVAGRLVMENGRLDRKVRPGRPIRAHGQPIQ
ncbi:MAG: amidohydrolase family protein [Bacteroidetes bacterium]|nr:amidohydrolase family protein [Bacteroidota bacterium]